MSTDRELLTLAARAAGHANPEWFGDGMRIAGHANWNPLADDGDALRLAVKLGLNLYTDRIDRWVACGAAETIFYDDTKFGGTCDPYAATRRAVVMAAAKIGETL